VNAVLSVTRAEAIALTGERSAQWMKQKGMLGASDAWLQLIRWIAERDVLVFVDDVTEGEVLERLSHEVAIHDIVILLAMIFDQSIPEETRGEIAADLERAIENRSHFLSLLARLYSEPFPSDANFDEVDRIALNARAVNLRALLKALEANQPAIRKTVLAWEAIPRSMFRDAEQSSEIRAHYRELGLFHSFARHASEQPIQFLFEWLPSTPSPANANHRRILMEWTKPFRQQSHHRHSKLDWRRAAQNWEESYEENSEDVAVEPTDAPKKRGKYYPGLISEIESRKESIRVFIRSGNLREAEAVAIALGDFQLEYGEPRFAAMSLCDLARFAEGIGQIPVGLRFIEHALAIVPGDSWSRIQHAGLLRAGGRPTEALAEYDRLLRDAELIPQHDVVTRCGYAECLRDLGKPDEALKRYKETLVIHPNYVIARNGYAECLRDLGTPDKALEWYRETLVTDPSYVVARDGYGECLRDLGKHNEALEWYRETLAFYPNVITRNATASVLVHLGRHAEALQMLPSSDPVTIQDWIALHIRGMAYFRAGDIDSSQLLFERGVSASLPALHAAYFRSALALCHLRRRDPSKAVETLTDVSDAKLQTTVNIIRVHAFGADGRIADCRDLLVEIGEPTRPLARALAFECRYRFIDRAPRKNEEWLFNGEIELLLAA
jgi:hypothetical protein